MRRIIWQPRGALRVSCGAKYAITTSAVRLREPGCLFLWAVGRRREAKREAIDFVYKYTRGGPGIWTSISDRAYIIIRLYAGCLAALYEMCVRYWCLRCYESNVWIIEDMVVMMEVSLQNFMFWLNFTAEPKYWYRINCTDINLRSVTIGFIFINLWICKTKKCCAWKLFLPILHMHLKFYSLAASLYMTS